MPQKITKLTTMEIINYFNLMLPEEACGLLVSEKNNQIINSFISIPNVSIDKLQQFRFDPKAYIEAIYNIEHRDGKILGIVHSHPTSDPFPSNEDLENWYYYDLSYWIYSFKNNSLNAYYITENKIGMLEYKII